MPRCSTVLMFSYTYPPAAAAGVFRTLRFVRYLPEFNWKPIVLTVKSESLHHARRDIGLDDLTPPGTVVERTSVFRPISKAAETLKRIISRRSANASNADVNRPQVHEESKPHGGSSNVPNFREVIRQSLKFFVIPDAQIGWILPATIAALRLIRQHRPEVLYSSSPPHSSHLIALLVCKLSGLPLVIDLRDPWARCEWKRHDGRVRNWMQSQLEGLCIRGSKCVVLNTPRMREEFCETYSSEPSEKFVAIPNGYDPEMRPHIEKLCQSHRSSPANGYIKICHPGTLYGERMLQPVVRAIEIANRAGLQVSLEQIGTVEQQSELVEYIRSRGLEESVTLLGRQSHDATLTRMAAADAFILLQPGTRMQVPGKLYEMMPFDKPILALTGPGQTAELVGMYRLGTVVNSNDCEAIADAIAHVPRMIASKQVSNGESCALKDFDGRSLVGQLAAVLERTQRHRVNRGGSDGEMR